MDNRNETIGRCCADAGADEAVSVPVMVRIAGQEWGCVYPEGRALCRGTLFPALDKPFFGKGGCCRE